MRGMPLGPIGPNKGSTTETKCATAVVDTTLAAPSKKTSLSGPIIQPLPDTLPETFNGLKVGDVVVTMPTQSSDVSLPRAGRPRAQSRARPAPRRPPGRGPRTTRAWHYHAV